MYTGTCNQHNYAAELNVLCTESRTAKQSLTYWNTKVKGKRGWGGVIKHTVNAVIRRFLKSAYMQKTGSDAFLELENELKCMTITFAFNYHCKLQHYNLNPVPSTCLSQGEEIKSEKIKGLTEIAD